MRRLIQKTARLFGVGQLPEALRRQMEAEGGLLWLEEGLLVTAILRGFKASGTVCSYRRMSFLGFAALSARRLIVSARCYDEASVDIAYDDPRFKAIAFRAAGNRLSVSFNAAEFLSGAVGAVTLRFGVSDLSKVRQMLHEKGARGLDEPHGVAKPDTPMGSDS